MFCWPCVVWGANDAVGYRPTISPQPYSYHQNSFLNGWVSRVRFPFCETQPLDCVADFFPLRKSKSVSTGIETGFSESTYGNIGWRYCFCFSPFQNGRSDHKFTVGTWTTFYLSITMQKKEGGKKKNSIPTSLEDWAFSESLCGNNTALGVCVWGFKASMFRRSKP